LTEQGDGCVAPDSPGLCEDPSFHARREAQKQWEANPCGASTVQGRVPETLEWFREARRFRYEEYAPWLRSATGIEEVRDCDVLEIGVGVGSDHYTLARGGNRMTALDLSREHLRLTSLHLSREGLSTRAIHGDMERMPFPDASFDVVYSFGVLHHTDHMDRAVAEVRRVLRPGGRAIIVVYHRDSLFFWAGIVAYRGVFRLGILRDGWAWTLARLEAGGGDGAVPVVRVQSRREFQALLGAIGAPRVSVHHFSNRFIQSILGKRRSESILGWIGWYLVGKVRK
jgi:SAM-dependent methyltransferase